MLILFGVSIDILDTYLMKIPNLVDIPGDNPWIISRNQFDIITQKIIIRLDELHKQYVVTARAKGLSNAKLLVKYPLRMALNPFIADIGNLLPQVVSGSVIVAVILDLPTTGPVLLDALRSQDTYLAGSFLLFISLLTVFGMFLSDLLLAVLDPRIRLTGGIAK